MCNTHSHFARHTHGCVIVTNAAALIIFVLSLDIVSPPLCMMITLCIAFYHIVKYGPALFVDLKKPGILDKEMSFLFVK